MGCAGGWLELEEEASPWRARAAIASLPVTGAAGAAAPVTGSGAGVVSTGVVVGGVGVCSGAN